MRRGQNGAGLGLDRHHAQPWPARLQDLTTARQRATGSNPGDDHIDLPPRVMPNLLKWARLIEKRPGAYIFIGNGDTAGVHHPAYDFNDEAAPYGVSLWAKIVEAGMPAR